MKKFAHLFSFYVIGSNTGNRYFVEDIATISEDHYRDILLGTCLRNMGIKYRIENVQHFFKIKDKLDNKLYKVGRIITNNKDITREDIKAILCNLGCNIHRIYLTKKELDFIIGIEEFA